MSSSPSGSITRQKVPDELVQHVLGGYPDSGGFMVPVADGHLVCVPGKFNDRRGLYLLNKSGTRRVWCDAKQRADTAIDDSCDIKQGLFVSPDGCRVAFSARPADFRVFDETVKVIDVCPNGVIRTLRDKVGWLSKIGI